MRLIRPATVLFAMGLTLLMVASVVCAARRPANFQQIDIRRTDYLISINHADQHALCTLPGVGRKMAVRIIEDRTTHGLFQSFEDITRVPGIGEKTLRRLRPMITLSQN